MLEQFLREGDAYDFERRAKADGKPGWDLASIASSTVAVLFANDTAYVLDQKESVFKFGPPRPVAFSFKLPVLIAAIIGHTFASSCNIRF